jgi:GT2 family glycosyltransferase
MGNTENLGFVVIGRNEGERLERCLKSLIKQCKHIVYVDSGSSDGSMELAKSLGLEAVLLDTSIPFTAARARNTGMEALQKKIPALEFVGFVDGDCELFDGWIEKSVQFLETNKDIAATCGRRIEKYPQASIYNLLCDIEWNTPVGYTSECGGDSIMRLTALNEAGGFDPTQIAGEEPELCYRLRKLGWKIYRMDADMTLHDANITRFYQWFKRAQRAGFAYAINASKHGREEERFCVKPSLRIWLWSIAIPIAIIFMSVLVSPALWIALAVYPFQFFRIKKGKQNTSNYPSNQLYIYSLFIQLGKWPEVLGQIQYFVSMLLSRKQTIIEYK